MNEYRYFGEIPKRVRNAINARINSAVLKYGFDAFKLVSNHYIDDIKRKQRLEEEIAEKEQALTELKRQKY